MMVRGLIVLLCFWGVVFATPSANEYIDTVLRRYSNEVRSMGLEPEFLPDFNASFAGETKTAEFMLGNVTNLSQARRAFECSGPKSFDGEMTINCTLSLNALKISYEVRPMYQNTIVVRGASVKVAYAYFDVIIACKPKEHVGSVKELKISSYNIWKPVISELPKNFQEHAADLSDILEANVRSIVRNLIPSKFISALDRALACIPMPRQ